MNIQRIKEKHEQKLLLFPNVVGVGVGRKFIKGASVRRACIKIYVQKKVPKSRLKKSEIIPKKLNGRETNVEEVGALKTQISK